MKSTVIIIFTLIESIVDYCIVFLPYPHKLKLTHINNMLIKNIMIFLFIFSVIMLQNIVLN